DAGKAPQAAETMRITAEDLLSFGIVDEVIPELVPAHENTHGTISAVGDAVQRALDELMEVVDQPSGLDRLMEQRYERFRRIGVWSEALPVAVD
ncbi:MAG: acetyl-CoA carboxylase carboxyl transferase subunit alpha, partial [Thermomicrobiales bacterium]|nr:acetyl-CoA carboxylase carboxyl transferase subunit alpha [Thermomicrobiales bacterium]